MACRKFSVFEEFLDWPLEFCQPQGIRDRGAVFSSAISSLFLGEMEFLNKPLECRSLLDRVQISRWRFSTRVISSANASLTSRTTTGTFGKAQR